MKKVIRVIKKINEKNHIFQEKVLRDSKAYILREKKNIDVSSSPLCFLTIWAETPGKYKLLDLLSIKII